MKRYNLILGIGILIICTALTDNTPCHIKEKGFEGYIFPKEYALVISFEDTKDRYTPTRQDIINVESIIKEQLATINKPLTNQVNGCPIIYKELKKYKRQYVGYINKEGDSIIWVNFIWGKHISDTWNKDVVIVLDGCSYYWNIKVNLSKKKAFDLQVNGPS
jgi:hypothetical protein